MVSHIMVASHPTKDDEPVLLTLEQLAEIIYGVILIFEILLNAIIILPRFLNYLKASIII